MFGHTLGAALGLGYVERTDDAPITAEWIGAGRYEIEVAAERVPARVSLRPFYDPSGERVKR
jgi:4-methylaminobutanoate oxidase (formaldehyde-forming)